MDSATLPNELDFTPLDVLTADEMNGLADNDNSLLGSINAIIEKVNTLTTFANSLATNLANGTGINDNTLTLAKLNKSTFTGATDANGWSTYYLPNGKRLWFKKGTFQTGKVLGQSWQFVNNVSALPSAYTTNCNVVASCIPSDSVFTVNIGLHEKTLRASVCNVYTNQSGYVGPATVTWGAIVIEV